jgi:hypothetical protein
VTGIYWPATAALASINSLTYKTSRRQYWVHDWVRSREYQTSRLVGRLVGYPVLNEGGPWFACWANDDKLSLWSYICSQIFCGVGVGVGGLVFYVVLPDFEFLRWMSVGSMSYLYTTLCNYLT